MRTGPAPAISISRSSAGTPSAPFATNAQFLVGQGHFDAGRFAEAVAPLERYLDANPKGDVADAALAYLALAYRRIGRADAAKGALDRLAKG